MGSTTSSRKRRWRRSPDIRVRRGAASTLLGSAERPFCSGGNLRTGSAITWFFLGWFAGGRLDRVPNVLLDLLQLGEQTVRVGGGDSLQRGRGYFGAQSAQFPEQWPRCLAQIEPVDATVGGVAASFDPAGVAELV